VWLLSAASGKLNNSSKNLDISDMEVDIFMKFLAYTIERLVVFLLTSVK